MANDIKRTQSTMFLLKPIGIVGKYEVVSKSKIKNFGFVNAFLKDVNHETQYEYPLYVLFKQDHLIAGFKEYEEEQYESGLLLEDYDYPDGYIVHVYDYPEKFRADYDKVKEGRYSECSKAFKDCFPEYVELNGVKEISVWYRIFNKDPEMRAVLSKEYDITLDDDSEVRSAPYLSEVPEHMKGKVMSEVLNIKNYVNG